MNIRVSYKELYYFIVAALLTNNVPLLYMNSNGMEDLANQVSSLLLYVAAIVAIIGMIKNNYKLKKSIPVIIFLGLLLAYQLIVVKNPVTTNYTTGFMIHGFGGFAIAISIDDYQKLIKKLCVLSFIYAILLIPEPITNHLLKTETMALGYTLAPISIWLILYYTMFDKYKKIIGFVAIALSLTTFLFTSRGSGVSILVAFIAFKLMKNKIVGKKNSKTLIALSIIGIAVYVGLILLTNSSLVSNMNLSAGSLLYKMIGQRTLNSNGRDYIWGLTLGLIKENWLLGLGFGGDRILFDSNYGFAHQVFLELFVNFGVPLGGIILFAYWYYVVGAVKKNTNNSLSLVIIAMISAYWIKLFFSDSYLNNMFNIMFILGIAITASDKYKGSNTAVE